MDVYRQKPSKTWHLLTTVQNELHLSFVTLAFCAAPIIRCFSCHIAKSNAYLDVFPRHCTCRVQKASLLLKPSRHVFQLNGSIGQRLRKQTLRDHQSYNAENRLPKIVAKSNYEKPALKYHVGFAIVFFSEIPLPVNRA